jgi:hypothetical protein
MTDTILKYWSIPMGFVGFLVWLIRLGGRSVENTKEIRRLWNQRREDLEASKAASVRYDPDRLLTNTDWIVIKSYERGENIPAEWETYRQALRDITSQAGFPYSVTWPTKPE